MDRGRTLPVVSLKSSPRSRILRVLGSLMSEPTRNEGVRAIRRARSTSVRSLPSEMRTPARQISNPIAAIVVGLRRSRCGRFRMISGADDRHPPAADRGGRGQSALTERAFRLRMLDRLEQFVEPFAARLTRPSPNHDRKTGSDSPRIPKACRPRSSSRCQSLPRRARRS